MLKFPKKSRTFRDPACYSDL